MAGLYKAMFTQLVIAQLFFNGAALKTKHINIYEEQPHQSYLGRRGVLEEDAAGNKVKLAKHVAAEKPPPFQTKIPRTIVQSWMSDGFTDPNSLWVPKERAEMMLTWLENNPTFDWRLFDDEDVDAYVAKNFDQQHLEALHSINQGASKVDFWRVLVVLHDGGVYMDSDTGCLVPLDEYVDSNATYVSGVGGNQDLHQFGIIAAPGNCIMRQTADLIMANVQEVKAHGTVKTEYKGLAGQQNGFIRNPCKHPKQAVVGCGNFAGPAVLQKAAAKCLTDPASSSTTLHGFTLCNGDVFGHRIMFKGPGIKGSTWNDGAPLLKLFESNNPTPEKCGQLILDK